MHEAEAAKPRRGRPRTAGLQEARREAIVASAFAVFTQKGYDETSIADIAAHTGIGHGTIYRYFSSKRELLDHVFDFAVEKADSVLTTAEPATVPEDYQQALQLVQTIGSRLFDLVDSEPRLLRLITVQGSAVDPELRDRVTGLLSMMDARLSKVFDDLAPSESERDWTQMGRLAVGLTGPGLIMTLLGETSQAKRALVLETAQAMIDRGVLTPAPDEGNPA